MALDLVRRVSALVPDPDDRSHQRKDADQVDQKGDDDDVEHEELDERHVHRRRTQMFAAELEDVFDPVDSSFDGHLRLVVPDLRPLLDRRSIAPVIEHLLDAGAQLGGGEGVNVHQSSEALADGHPTVEVLVRKEHWKSDDRDAVVKRLVEAVIAAVRDEEPRLRMSEDVVLRQPSEQSDVRRHRDPRVFVEFHDDRLVQTGKRVEEFPNDLRRHVVDFNICHRMASMRKLYSTTLTYFFKITKLKS